VLGSEENSVMVNGLLGDCRRGKNFSIWAEFGFLEGSIVTNDRVGREKILSCVWDDCMRSIQYNMDYGYELTISSRNEETHRKRLVELDGCRSFRMHIDFSGGKRILR
jgi:hypothetical protein